MLFHPSERGFGLIGFVIFIAIVLLVLALSFCWWPFNTDACRSNPF